MADGPMSTPRRLAAPRSSGAPITTTARRDTPGSLRAPRGGRARRCGALPPTTLPAPVRHGCVLCHSAVVAAGSDVDVLVVGGGLAGASLATVLARDGATVLVVE